MNGKVILVGAGPGDVGLLTLKGKAVLQQADVVVYDKLVGQGVLALIPPTARRIDVGKRASHHPIPQHQINQILLEEALAGNLVVRLKGGDPFLFGRGGEELELLVQHGIDFEIVPGVTSALSVPAYAGIPVTHRDCTSSLHIITGHTKTAPEAQIDFASLVKLKGTLVFLMGVSAMESICTGLLAGGMSPDMPAAVLERGTTAHQRRVVSTVQNLVHDAQAANIKTPAIIVVGKVCALAEQFHWAEERPLGGVRIVVTRPRELASTLTEKLRALGAEVVELPSIQTAAIENNAALAFALTNLGRYGWITFTSPSGVRIFFEELRARGQDIRSLAGLKIAAIGSATAHELEKRGLLVDLKPSAYNAGQLGAALGVAAKGTRILITRARVGSPDLTAALDAAGIPYDDVPLYDTLYTYEQADSVREQLACGEIDYVAFTSASTVRGFVGAIGDFDFSQVNAICIGEQTALEAQKHRIKTVIAQAATIDSMVALLTDLHRQK
ncbi:uroporphyrinogen-III C-methyltransferase [Hydrogenoanaerobacterium sp.]|uniref:uroporphyrinogen-III C-methyltransferase n=1 Tax=Hydrogenoanaerobacterium sp. TaxID=2953763 RepID=UPI00289B9FF7|nr:uroporphyrinogen-III C-methyltransferase [Hydrogenoanaerobacterium sp.]